MWYAPTLVQLHNRITYLENELMTLRGWLSQLTAPDKIQHIGDLIGEGGYGQGVGRLADVFEMGTHAANPEDRESRLMLNPNRTKCINFKGQTGPLGLVRGFSGEFISKYDY